MVEPVETGEEPSRRDASVALAGTNATRAHGLSSDDVHALLEIGSDWVWETDEELRFSWLSDSFNAVTGVDPAAVLGGPAAGFFFDCALFIR